MFFYILLFILIVGILRFSKNEHTVIFAFFVLWAVYAFRNNVGMDDGNYIQAFEFAKRGWGYDIEWSYLALSKLIASLGFNYKLIFMVYGAISISLLYKTVHLLYRTNSSKALYMVCFFGTVFVSSISVMRQFLSACFCFYAAAIMSQEYKPLKSIIYCAIGSIFHMASIISIPFILLMRPKIRITYSQKILILLMCLCAGYLNVSNFLLNMVMRFLPSSYQIYSSRIDGSYSSAGGTLSLILLMLFLVQTFISWKAKKTEPQDTQVVIVEKGQFIYLCLLFFFVHAGVASRLAFTFLPFSATIPVTFIRRVHTRQRPIVVFALSIAMLLLMIMTLNNAAKVQSGAFIPYNASFKFWN